VDFDTLAGIKTGVGKWYQKKRIFNQNFAEYMQIYKNHPIGSRELEKYGLNLIQSANRSLGLPYEKIECEIYKYQPLKITLPKDYIVVSNGVDTWHKGLRQTKSWEHAEWKRLVKMLKCPVIQVGTDYDIAIEGAIDLRSATTVQQMLTVLRDAKGIVCTEGGLMHLGYAVGNQNTFVLKGPTAGCFFAYPGQHDIVSRVCHGCYWDTPEWYKDCPKNLDGVCTKSITAERVYNIIKGEMNETLDQMQDPSRLQLDYGLFGDIGKYIENRASI